MFKVIIVGVRGAQIEHLRRRLPGSVMVRSIDARRVLRLRAANVDLVLCTRFISHKHQWHLARVLGCPVEFCQGGIGAWANMINDHAGRCFGGVGVGRAC